MVPTKSSSSLAYPTPTNASPHAGAGCAAADLSSALIIARIALEPAVEVAGEVAVAVGEVHAIRAAVATSTRTMRRRNRSPTNSTRMAGDP